MRIPHILRGNATCELPQAAIWLDTESKQRRVDPTTVSHHLWFGWACFQRQTPRSGWTTPEWYEFHTIRGLWDWVEAHMRRKTRVYCFAHNWAFDAAILHVFSELPRRGFVLNRAVIDSPPVIVSWRREQATLTLLDTLNWFRMPLKKLGKSVGYAKLDMPSKSASKEAWSTYGKADVEVIRRAVQAWWAFIERHDLGGFAPTLAGQAFKAYRHRFMKHDILIDSDPDALPLARSSYYGGRTEAFFIGKRNSPVHCYDVNSMYPHVMASEEYPTILQTYCRKVEHAELARWLDTYAVIARVDIETKSPQYAIKQKGKLIFPVGRFTVSLTTPDLKAAMAQGHVKRIHEAALYDKAPLFSHFVNEIYDLRTEAKRDKDDVQAWLLKILLNSLYGKFAQRGTVWDTVTRCSSGPVEVWKELDLETGILYSMRRFGKVIQQRKKNPESYDSHPAIASHVTAYARRHLWDLMSLAGHDNVLYCDTDSLYVTSRGRNRLASHIDSTRLGGLKHEASYPWLSISGCKDYESPDGRTIKGIRPNATRVNENTFVQEEWTTLRGLLALGRMEAPVTRTKVKVLARIYDKGKVLSTGKVKPLLLREF